MLSLKDRYEYRDIFNAYMDCRQSKRNSPSAMAFETRFEMNLLELLEEINSGEYTIGRSEVFVQEWPKAREIWAATFRDRVVQHLVHNDTARHFEVRFIEDTFSCIEGRGTLAANNRLRTFHRRATGNYATDCWVLQFDVKNFFGSIDKHILWQRYEDEIGADSLTSKLLHQIIWNDPTVNPIIKQGSRFDLVPPHKSLYSSPFHVGLAIGNLTSQTSSNVHMDPLDKYVKHVLKAKHYVRYVDDAVILSHDRDYLYDCLEKINDFVENRLNMQLHPDKSAIFPASQGINFVGYIVKPWRRYARNMTVASAKNVADQPPSEKSLASLNSYLGILKHADSFKLRKKLCERATLPSITMPGEGFTKIVTL
jgi:hypothetical protein